MQAPQPGGIQQTDQRSSGSYLGTPACNRQSSHLGPTLDRYLHKAAGTERICENFVRETVETETSRRLTVAVFSDDCVFDEGNVTAAFNQTPVGIDGMKKKQQLVDGQRGLTLNRSGHFVFFT